MGGMLLGVSGGGGVSEGKMSGSSHGSEMITLPCKRFALIETEIIRFSCYFYFITFRHFYNSQTGKTIEGKGLIRNSRQGNPRARTGFYEPVGSSFSF